MADYPTGAVLVLVSAAILEVRRRRFRVVRPDVPPWSFRKIRDDATAIPGQLRQSIRVRRR
jgi:hypothetical protein